MEKNRLRQLSLFTLLVWVFWSTTLAAQIAPDFEPPPLVRFTGALLPLADKDHGSLFVLTVTVKEKQWTFKIVNVENLTGGDPSGWKLLDDLFPPELRFTGPEELLGPLQKPEIAGKPLTIEGRLYSADRMLLVTAVGEATEKPK